MLNVVDKLIAAFVADFSLGGKSRNIDIFGAHGFPLSARAGYIDIDNKKFRIMDITVPVIVNDVWSEG